MRKGFEPCTPGESRCPGKRFWDGGVGKEVIPSIFKRHPAASSVNPVDVASPKRISPALLRQASYGTIKIGTYNTLKKLFVSQPEGMSQWILLSYCTGIVLYSVKYQNRHL